jgi:hypothetical protein
MPDEKDAMNSARLRRAFERWYDAEANRGPVPVGIHPKGLAELNASRVGAHYEPSNGTEGSCFIDAWCSICERDKVMNGDATDEDADRDQGLYCPILGSSFFDGGAKEWQYDKNGQPCCIAFVPKGEAIPTPRCPHTMELPLESAQIFEFKKGTP